MRKLRQARGVALAALLLALLAGCTSDGGSDDGDVVIGGGGVEPPECGVGEVYNSTTGNCDPLEAEEPTESAQPIEMDTTGQFCTIPSDADFEGYYSETQMLDFLSCVVPAVDRWINTVYQAMPHPKQYIFIPVGTAIESGCLNYDGTTTADEVSMAYCSTDATVYIGEAATWDYYINNGDAAMFMVIAHEVGHHFQEETGIYDWLGQNYAVDGKLPPAAVLLGENQADCVAGAYMHSLLQAGVMVEDDLGDLDAIIAAIASSEDSPNRDHGTIQERTQSFLLSFTDQSGAPMATCNQLIAGAPVLYG